MVDSDLRLNGTEAVAVIAVAEVIGVQSFGDFFGHEPSVAEQRSAVKHLDDIQLFLCQCLRFQFLCLRLVIRNGLEQMAVSGGNNAVIGKRRTEATEQFIRLISRKQVFKPPAVKLRACVFKNILLEESVRSVGFGSKFITPQVLCRIQRVMNACRVFGIENGFEFNLFGFRHSGNPLCETIQLIDSFHALKHIRGDLWDGGVKLIAEAEIDFGFAASPCNIKKFIRIGRQAQIVKRRRSGGKALFRV